MSQPHSITYFPINEELSILLKSNKFELIKHNGREPQREVLNLSQLVNFRLNLIHVVEAVHHSQLVHNPCDLVIIRFVC